MQDMKFPGIIVEKARGNISKKDSDEILQKC